jgi:hypothetical protein
VIRTWKKNSSFVHARCRRTIRPSSASGRRSRGTLTLSSSGERVLSEGLTIRIPPPHRRYAATSSSLRGGLSRAGRRADRCTRCAPPRVTDETAHASVHATTDATDLVRRGVFVQPSCRLVIRGGGLDGEDRDRRPAVVAAVHALRAGDLRALGRLLADPVALSGPFRVGEWSWRGWGPTRRRRGIGDGSRICSCLTLAGVSPIANACLSVFTLPLGVLAAGVPSNA